MARAKQLTTEELKQQVRERTREVHILHRISESISSTLEQETVLKQIVEVVVEVTKADACLLYLISENKDELILRASKNPHPRLIGRISIGLGEGITGWVAKEKVPVVVSRNASDDARFKFFGKNNGIRDFPHGFSQVHTLPLHLTKGLRFREAF